VVSTLPLLPVAALTPLPLLPTSVLAVIAAVASLSPPLLPISAMLLMLLPAVDAALLPMSPSSLLPVAALPLLPVSALQPQLPRSPRSLRCRCYLSPLLPISALPPLLLRLFFGRRAVVALQIVLLRCRRCIYAAAVVLVAAQIAALPLLPISTLPLLLFLRCCPCHRRRCCYTAARLRDAAAIDVGLLLTAQGLPPSRLACSAAALQPEAS